jgi:hypothetical protein
MEGEKYTARIQVNDAFLKEELKDSGAQGLVRLP